MSTNYEDQYYPCNNRRRREYHTATTNKIVGTVEIHNRCCICNKWYMRRDTGSFGPHIYCTNCSDQFESHLKEHHPETWAEGKKFGVFKR